MAKVIRRAIAILLAATAIILLVIPASDVNATYTKGDYVIDGGTLVSYTGNESDITIPIGISSIGKDAFSGNNTLKKVYIPDEVKSIDYAAFENCKNLEKVSIGDGVKSIGSAAFSGCQSLSDINIPKATETIGSGTFAACPSLSNIKVSDKNRNFVCLDGVLYSKDGKKMYQYLAGRPYSIYDIPEPVTEIGEFGFYGANMLTTVGIVKGVEEIPEYAFLNCTALNQVTIPSSVKAIRKGAFGGCPNLTKLAVPTTVGYIDEEAFTSMDGVKGDVVNDTTGEVLSESNQDSSAKANINRTSETANEDTNKNSDSDDADDSEASDDEQTDENIIDKAENVISDQVENVLSKELGSTRIVGGEAMFLINPKSMKVKGFDIDAAQTEDSIADSGNSSSAGEDIRGYSGNEFDIITGILGHYGNSDSSVNIPANVNKIGNRVFYNNKTLENVTIPDSVNEIGDFAFARSALKSVDIPSNVDKIGYAAFYNCADLSSVNVPSTVKEIELGAFDNTAFINNWKSIEDGNNFLILGDGILVAYKGHNSEVNIPVSVKSIGPGVFEGNTRIKTINFTNNCLKISEDAFNGCKKLSEITLPADLEIIEDRAFKDTNLKYVEIPTTVREIGLGAFDTVNVNGGLDAVLFKGSFLPNVTSKPTATRLSAKDLRTNAFNGTEYAFVPSGVNLGSGSIFDPDKYGFRGEVYSSASDGNLNYIQLRKCIKEPDINGKVLVDSEVNIGNSTYYMSGVSESAFDAYKDSKWCKNKLSDIELKGSKSSELDSLLAGINYNADSSDSSKSQDIISIVSPDGSMNTKYCDATLPNSSENFTLSITKDSSLVPDFNQAFDNRYGTHSGISMDTYSIDMTDRLGTVPIKKMANEKLNITLPVPSAYSESENIRVATLDDNGLLENIAGDIYTKSDGTKTVSFVASHLSPFAIFVSNEDLIQNVDGDIISISEEGLTTVSETVTTEESLAEGVSNVISENIILGTLEKKTINGIPARYLVAVIMLCASVLLLLYNKKQSKGAHYGKN